ncbi:hypothetical protein [Bacillus cereus]|nr:hypothetical protein [Bacillus cereus]MCQ6330332.1 hypothetical protein [Bacillus cereus]
MLQRGKGMVYLAKKFEYTPQNREWFKSFIQSDGFSEALGIVWKYGGEQSEHFEMVIKNCDIVNKFATLVRGTTPVKPYFRTDDNCQVWHCNISLNHPFLRKIKQMGWTPLIEQERAYPKGEFNHAIFIKTYILMRHDVGIIKKKNRNGAVVVCARLRVHGSADMLQHITQHLHDVLGTSVKKVQTDSKIERAKTLYYQSKKEIPIILKYIDAKESLEKFNSFKLGCVENTEEV